MTNKTPSGTEKHHESTESETPKRQNCFSSSSSSSFLSSDGLAQHCVNLSCWLHTKQQHFILSSARPHCFLTTLKNGKALVATHLNTIVSNLGRHFLYFFLRMRT